MSQMTKTEEIQCQMVHHGAAACLSPHCLLWLPHPSRIAYASHGILNICTNKRVVVGNDSVEQVWTVTHTLCSRSVATAAPLLPLWHSYSMALPYSWAFPMASVTCWHYNTNKEWTEQPFFTQKDGRSITHLDGHYFETRPAMDRLDMLVQWNQHDSSRQ